MVLYVVGLRLQNRRFDADGCCGWLGGDSGKNFARPWCHMFQA